MVATAQSVVALLSKDFLKLVVAGFILAVPVGYYIIQRWLEDFAYRIEIGADVFVLAGLVVLAITLLTVSFHALRAALINPTEGIRNE
jgi:putative ABC transport system permease protein